MTHRALRILLLLTVLSASSAAAQTCPQTCTDNWPGALGLCYTAPARDTSGSASCSPYPDATSHISYNLVLGELSATAATCPVGGSSYGFVDAHDRFRLVGPSGGGSIAFEARFTASGSAGFPGTVSASVREVGGATQSVNDGGNGGFIQTLVLPLLHAVGEEFELAYEVGASAATSAHAEGTLWFAGLPAGYGIASCQGFQGVGAVPTRLTSWGSVKALYR